jgi:hypothetical protein
MWKPGWSVVPCVLLAAAAACAPPVWEVPGGLPHGGRVRVVAPRLSEAWEPGRLVRGRGRCWTVEVAVDSDPKALEVVTPGELRRLQLSQASPPPDWWALPVDDEYWIEIPPEAIAAGGRPGCERATR